MTTGVWKLQDIRDLILAGENKSYYSLGLEPGPVWVWGFQYQTPFTNCSFSSPVQLPGTNWCEFYHCTEYAKKGDGTIWYWGDEDATGKSGLNSNALADYSSPVQLPGTSWASISAGSGLNSGFGIKTDGTMWVWGNNSCGEHGLNDRVFRSSPTQLPGTQWSKVVSGLNVSVLALKTDGTLWSWGNNASGYGGYGLQASNRSSPVQIPGTQWVDIDMTFALKSDGTLWSWGNRVGDNAQVCRSSPVQIPGTSWVNIRGQCNVRRARKTDGTLWAWGLNNGGQLGDGTAVHRSSPVQIPGTNWACNDESGAFQSFVRKTDNTLWVWGCNASGELGDNTIINRSSPVQLPGTAWGRVLSVTNQIYGRKSA